MWAIWRHMYRMNKWKIIVKTNPVFIHKAIIPKYIFLIHAFIKRKVSSSFIHAFSKYIKLKEILAKFYFPLKNIQTVKWFYALHFNYATILKSAFCNIFPVNIFMGVVSCTRRMEKRASLIVLKPLFCFSNLLILFLVTITRNRF